jgi:hypothetical protein
MSDRELPMTPVPITLTIEEISRIELARRILAGETGPMTSLIIKRDVADQLAELLSRIVDTASSIRAGSPFRRS